MPDARQLIRDTTFDADTVSMMGAVLDAAWELIEHAFNGQPQATIDAARAMLAKAIIDRVSLGLLQPEILKDEAIRAVKLSYPHLPI